MCVGVADVVGRYAFNKPIVAVLEVSQVMLAIMVFLGWTYTMATRGHIRVTILHSRFSPRSRTVIDFVISLVVLVLFGLIAWQGLEIAIEYWRANVLVWVIYLPLAYFQIFVFIGATIVCLEVIVQILELLPQLKGAH